MEIGENRLLLRCGEMCKGNIAEVLLGHALKIGWGKSDCILRE